MPLDDHLEPKDWRDKDDAIQKNKEVTQNMVSITNRVNHGSNLRNSIRIQSLQNGKS